MNTAPQNEGTLEDEFKRIAEKYGYDNLSDISQALDAGEIHRKDARKLLVDLGKPISQLNTRDEMRARGVGEKPTPRTAEEASVQAAIEIVMKILKGLFGIRTAEEIEQDCERLEQARRTLNIERNHAEAVRTLNDVSKAANDDEFRVSSTSRHRRL
ncbi:hypothetical protein [Comamonas sp. wu1-DMT]|uniref:hypothetical protein n=1 Tax=Comamonas sp. wu1-DMT TaxID=3126390 RepID=UPI0032E40DA1